MTQAATTFRRARWGEPTPAFWIDAPTLRLDDAGRKSAARQIANPIDEWRLTRAFQR